MSFLISEFGMYYIFKKVFKDAKNCKQNQSKTFLRRQGGEKNIHCTVPTQGVLLWDLEPRGDIQ